MSRTKAKNELSLDQYKEEMAGVYTTSVNENTLDEAPMAYKSLEDIIDVIRESVHLSGLKSTEMSLRRMAELHIRRQLRCCAARPQILFEIFDLTRKAGKRRQASVKRSGRPFGGGSYVYDAND